MSNRRSVISTAPILTGNIESILHWALNQKILVAPSQEWKLRAHQATSDVLKLLSPFRGEHINQLGSFRSAGYGETGRLAREARTNFASVLYYQTRSRMPVAALGEHRVNHTPFCSLLVVVATAAKQI